jgi:hypothetical protein
MPARARFSESEQVFKSIKFLPNSRNKSSTARYSDTDSSQHSKSQFLCVQSVQVNRVTEREMFLD